MMRDTRTLAAGPGLPAWRIKALLWLLVFFAVVLTGKLFYLQVVQNSFLGG